MTSRIPRYATMGERITNSVIVDKVTGCWEWKFSKTFNGYGIYRANKKNLRAHRLSYTAFVGEIPDGLFVLHRCDNRPCVNPSHLFLGTIADNNRDAAQKGRLPRYDKNASGKLTEQDVAEIVARAKAGETYAALAKDYGVSSTTTSKWGLKHGLRRGPGWRPTAPRGRAE